MHSSMAAHSDGDHSVFSNGTTCDAAFCPNSLISCLYLMLLLYLTVLVSSPCQENNGGCSQLCFPLPDSEIARCACTVGVLGTDGQSCTGRTALLLYNDDSSL